MAIATMIAVIAATAPAAQSAATSPAEPSRRVIAAAELPLLPSEPVRPTTPAAGRPGVAHTASALGERDPGSPTNSDAVAEVIDRRTANARVFRNSDESLSIDEYSAPIHHKTVDGYWVPIDNTLRPVANRPGWAATSENDWTVAFGTLSQGLELSTGAGTVTMVPARETKDASDVAPTVASRQRPVGPRLPKDELADSAVPPASTVEYRAVQPGTDLHYEVRANGVKEDIVLHSASASPTQAFDITGTDLALSKDGGVRLSGAVGELFSIPAPTVTATDGTDLTAPSGVHYEISDPNGAQPGMRLTVALDQRWLAKQPASVFPLRVDPTFWAESPASSISHSSTGGTYAGVQIGRDSSGTIWRGAMHFSAYEAYISGGYRAYYAFIEFEQTGGPTGNTDIKLYNQGNQPTAYSQIGSASGSQLPPTITDDGDPMVGDPLTIWSHDAVDNWLVGNDADQWFGVRGTESGTTLRQYNVRQSLRVYQPPAASHVTNISNDQVLSTLTPTLHAYAVPDSPDGQLLPFYEFQITTGNQPGSGMVLSYFVQGGTDPTWEVPAGALQEGITYYAWVLTDWTGNSAGIPPTIGASRKFTVNLGLGEGGPSPTDSVGSVPGSTSTPAEGAPSPSLPSSKLTVNMVDGNLSMSLGSKALDTLAGGVNLGFTYNSLTANSQGLRAEFFNDANGNWQIDDGTDVLVGERTDPGVNFDWDLTSTAVIAQDATKALGRWTGALTLPSSPSGQWQLGAISSDGLKITSGSTVLLDRWASHEPEAAPVFGSSFTPTPGMPIKIEWRNGSGQAVAHVVARDSLGKVYELAADWLSRSPRALPFGWTLNANAGAARWVGLQDRGTSVSVFAADGSAHEFKAADNSAYSPPLTAPSDLLSLGDAGRFVLQSDTGQVYTFRSDGVLESLVNAVDDLNPAALEYGYSGSPLQLRTVRDRVSNRTVNLSYGGDSACGTVPSAATGLLCQIAYWDNTSTTLTYDSSGRLTRITHPGGSIYDLAYNSSGLLKSVRNPLAAEVVAAGLRTNDATVLTEITYSGGRVATVTQPAPSAGSARPQRTYTYGSGQTEVDVAGFSPPSGFAERVKYDDRNRITERTDTAGLTTLYTWDASDRLIATTDPADLKSTTKYDHASRPTVKYGPAPKTFFNASGDPTTAGTVPFVTTEYDGNIAGLAGTYWTNPYLAGAPGRHGTGLGSGGDMDKDWNTTLPVTPGAGGWSTRFSGDVNITTAGNHTWQIQTRGSRGRVWVDDTLVADLNQTEPATGWGSATGTAQTLSAGWHRIRVDMVDTSGPAGLQVLWETPGSQTFVTVPGTALTPAYGLVTKVTESDGKITTTEYSDSAAGIGPEYRLPTATVADPTGANPLRTVTTYESPGSGSYLRRLSRTLPAGNTSTTTHYGPTEGPPGPFSAPSTSARSWTAAGNTVTSSVTINTPAGIASGDVLIAGIATRGGSNVIVVPPAGWTLIRTDNNSTSLQLSSYWHVAGSSEPSTYTWTLTEGGNPVSKAAAGTITAYTGIDPLMPIDTFGGQVEPNDSLSIVAPSITTTVANDVLVGLFTIANPNPIAPPTGMTERGEANSNVSGQAKIAVESADSTQASAGATGTHTATATSGSAARTNGQLIALRPLTTGPCGVPSSTSQAGKPKRITDPDPDGAGPQAARAEEFIYDAVGRQVGRRVGTTATISSVAWSCSTYDARGRITSESWPATATAPTRTVNYLYAVGGNPLINAVSDTVWGSAGVSATVDLLGRVVSYSDIYNGTTDTTYDQAGRTITVNGPGGNRTQNYTAEGRPGTVQVDGVTLATPTYHSGNGRLTSVAYANGTTTAVGYDTYGRASTTNTATGSGTVTGDQVTYSLGGRVSDQSVYTGSGYVDANPSGANFSYDGAGRLTAAHTPGSSYIYGYGTSSSCPAPAAWMNTNRSTLTITGTGAASKSYCYDHADRLVSSTDHATGSVVYDDHGNTTQLGTMTLDFDAADRHVRTETPTIVTRYWRDPLDRIVSRVDLTRTTHIASTTATASGTGISVNRPAGTQAGDLIFAALTIANPEPNLSATGWTVAASQAQGIQRTWTLWRYATDTDPGAWTLSTDGTTTDLSAAVVTYRGPNAANPVAVTASTPTSGATSHPLPQVTTTGDAHHLVHVVGLSGNATATPPSTATTRASQAGAVSLFVADRYQSQPGNSPADNATTGTAMNSASLTVAIAPGATSRRLGHAGHADSASHLADSTGTTIEKYYSLPGGVTITETAGTQSLNQFSDDFTGTNDAVWNSSKWTTTSNDQPPTVTKRVDIQSNQGQLYVNGSSARATATMTPIVNSEATMLYRFSDRNTGSFLRVSMRGSGATGANQMPDAYRLEIASGSPTITLQKFANSTVTSLGSFTHTQDTNAQRVRFRVQGSSIQAKVWADGTTEPANWSVTATDSAVSAAGVLQVAHSHTSGARSVYLDDVNVTADSAPRIWSYTNLHGDVTATADNTGTRTWIGWYGPYGEKPDGSVPANESSAGTSWGWHGKDQRLTDRDLIHMGVRPYAPSLGRFLAVDPIQGGCANDYVYVYGDPINQSDLNGKAIRIQLPDVTAPFRRLFNGTVRAAKCDPIGSIAVGSGVVAILIPPSAPLIGGFFGSLSLATGFFTTLRSYGEGNNYSGTVGATSTGFGLLQMGFMAVNGSNTALRLTGAASEIMQAKSNNTC